MQLRSLALGCLFALAAPACSPESPEPAEQTGVITAAETAPTRIYASEADLDLSFETLGTFEERDGVRALILRATANRYLESVYSFVPDDIFGDAHIISERRLEVVLHEGYELNSVLSGLPLFVAVNTFTGTPTSYTARVVVSPRFYDFRGSSNIWIDSPVNPVYVLNGADNLLYRGAADALANQLTVTAPDGAPTVGRVDADSFRLDWTYTALHQAIDPHTTPLTFTANLTSGTTEQKTARLVARVTELALTTGDAYEVWPMPDCQASTSACMQAQPAGTTDFSACGTYRQVLSCTYGTTCGVGPFPSLSLTEIDASSLESARAAWNAGQSTGYDWREVTNIDAYGTPVCTNEPTTIQAIVSQLYGGEQGDPSAYGTYTDRAGLSQSFFFENHDGRGAALLSAVDAFAGGGDVQVFLLGEELSCHNCHDFGERAILYYPATHKVIVLDGHHGYDS